MGLGIRQITSVGHSLAVTIPRDMLQAYGLTRGALVEVRPTEQGLLIQPAKIVSALEPNGTEAVKQIVHRYQRAFDAMAKEQRTIDKR